MKIAHLLSTSLVGAFVVWSGVCLAEIPQTGADLIKGHAAKKTGYSEAQLMNIAKALKGRELTFEGGKVLSVSKDEDDGSVTMSVVFESPGEDFKLPFAVQAKVARGQARQAEGLDEGTRVRRLTGTVKYDPDFFLSFEIVNATFEADAPAATGAAVDYGSMTGADLIKGHAAKKTGYSEAQLMNIAKALKGRELTFEGGKVLSVSKDEDDGSVTMTVVFDSPGDGFKLPFAVQAKVSRRQARQAEGLDEGTKVGRLTGTVKYDPDLFLGFEIVNATFAMPGSSDVGTAGTVGASKNESRPASSSSTQQVSSQSVQQSSAPAGKPQYTVAQYRAAFSKRTPAQIADYIIAVHDMKDAERQGFSYKTTLKALTPLDGCDVALVLNQKGRGLMRADLLQEIYPQLQTLGTQAEIKAVLPKLIALSKIVGTNGKRCSLFEEVRDVDFYQVVIDKITDPAVADYMLSLDLALSRDNLDALFRKVKVSESKKKELYDAATKRETD